MFVKSKSVINALLAGAACVAFLSACATPTPYQPAMKTASRYEQGYSDTKIEDNRYRLKFSGNPETPRDTVEEYMLYRAAELTMEKGYDYFTVVTRDTKEEKRFSTEPYGPYGPGGFSWRFGYVHRGWSAWGADYEVSTVEYDRYEAIAEIILWKGTKPENDPHAYDAREVIKNLEPKIVRPAAPK